MQGGSNRKSDRCPAQREANAHASSGNRNHNVLNIP